MLDIAIKHKEELKKKMLDTWFQDKYKYYNYDLWYSDQTIDDETWNRHQFVSLDRDGNLIGYISYSVCRQTHNCSKLVIINFSDNKVIFGRDLAQVLIDIFEKFKFNKLSFSVVIGNPAEKSYDKWIRKYNGKIVGIKEKETRLMDGDYYDVKLYEIMRDNYLETKNKKLIKNIK